ncbi:MAG: class I SAM-dependent methyltransferase, partial [Spirochaetia bacterium]|nr:class I SAM-dependent methyltransferase [Spirochaetia bacterium]
MGIIRNIALRMKTGTEDLNYGRAVIQDWASDYLVSLANQGKKRVHLLDIGCGQGTDLLNAAYGVRTKSTDKIPEIRLSGIEGHGPYREACAKVGIETFALDIEQDQYPGKEGTYDVIIANQVLEHLKEVFWVMAEVGRILKPGGRFIVGVPNLASLHNRMLLLFGQQPSAQQTLSAHVRTFTKPDFKR